MHKRNVYASIFMSIMNCNGKIISIICKIKLEYIWCDYLWLSQWSYPFHIRDHNRLIKVYPVTGCRYLSRKGGVCATSYSCYNTEAVTNVRHFADHLFTVISCIKSISFWFPFNCNILLKGPITNKLALNRQWLGVEHATSLYFNQWWHSLATSVCGTRWVMS